ncbi:AraC family ligand binding domain-containing protein [Paenibacillus sp. sptzw28]|nr:AraC family ligand binding domain-containing protein [Paenibacillus sp. sptzw28]
MPLMNSFHSYHSYSSNGLIYINNGYKFPNMHRWGPGVRDVYSLHYIVSGKGTLETRNTSFPLKAGESFVILPYTEIYYYPDPQDPWEYVWIEFKGDEVPHLLSITEFAPDKPVAAEAPSNLEPMYGIASNADAKPFEKMRSDAELRLLLSYRKSMPHSANWRAS